MPKTTLFLLVILALSLAIFVSVFYFALPAKKNNISADSSLQQTKTATAEEEDARIKKEYPEIVQGVISFHDVKTDYKAIIKTDDGKEYVVFPPQPRAVYESIGIKNGQKVEVRAKFVQNGLRCVSIKPI